MLVQADIDSIFEHTFLAIDMVRYLRNTHGRAGLEGRNNGP